MNYKLSVDKAIEKLRSVTNTPFFCDIVRDDILSVVDVDTALGFTLRVNIYFGDKVSLRLDSETMTGCMSERFLLSEFEKEFTKFMYDYILYSGFERGKDVPDYDVVSRIFGNRADEIYSDMCETSHQKRNEYEKLVAQKWINAVKDQLVDHDFIRVNDDNGMPITIDLDVDANRQLVITGSPSQMKISFTDDIKNTSELLYFGSCIEQPEFVLGKIKELALTNESVFKPHN